MLATETTEGLARLSVLHETILPYAPFQNGKQEHFWTQIEGRLLPMLEGVADLTLAQLNEATLAWVEMEYNKADHSELGQAPLQRYLHQRDVGRPCPSSAELKMDKLIQQYALTGLPPAYLPKPLSTHDTHPS